MNVQKFALVYGLVFLVSGVAAFVPAFVTPHDAVEHELLIPQGAGYFLGLFPTNALHNLGHAAAGIWGLVVYRDPRAALVYARILALGLALVAIIGFIPRLNTLFGLVPLHGNYIWFHAALAPGAFYFGFLRRAQSARAADPGA
jgi:hypothetical protein